MHDDKDVLVPLSVRQRYQHIFVIILLLLFRTKLVNCVITIVTLGHSILLVVNLLLLC